jgi:hypothetical protein
MFINFILQLIPVSLLHVKYEDVPTILTTKLAECHLDASSLPSWVTLFVKFTCSHDHDWFHNTDDYNAATDNGHTYLSYKLNLKLDVVFYKYVT